MIEYMPKKNAADRLKRMIDSKQFWVFFADQNALLALKEIEEKYFDGEAAPDFEIVVNPPIPGVTCIVLANKRRLTAEQLSDFLNNNTKAAYAVTVEQLKARDLLYLLQSEKLCEEAARGAHKWLFGIRAASFKNANLN